MNFNNSKVDYSKEKTNIKEDKLELNFYNCVNQNKKNEIQDNPKDMQFLNILSKDSYSYYDIDNSFCIFKSINDIYYLIYANEYNSSISYNIIDNKKIIEIKNFDNNYGENNNINTFNNMNNITNFRHFLDKNNKRDLIISISASQNNIKIWDINNWECLINLDNINKSGILLSACLLNNNNYNYIITTNTNFLGVNEFIKIFDFNGKKIKEINYFNENIYHIETFYDNKSSKIYIVTANDGCVISYDYNNDKIYHKYSENDKKRHYSLIINKEEKLIKIIESSLDSNIRIWNFDSGELLKKINIMNNKLYGLCLWNNEYLFVGCEDNSIKLIDIKNGIIVKELFGYNNKIISIQKIILPKFGKSLISIGGKKSDIKLWVNKI